MTAIATTVDTAAKEFHANQAAMRTLVAELEQRFSGRDILLVSHGDTLQILQAGFRGMSPARHRGLPHLDTAEIRRIDMVDVNQR